MQRSRSCRAALAATLAVSTLLAPARGEDEPYKPLVAGPSAEASMAAKSIRLAPGLKLELFAAEPLLANPVAFCFDERGRLFVAETFRLNSGVTDNRSHMNWLDADMAARTVADRVAMYRKYLSPEEFQGFHVEHERVRLVEDSDGDGKADKATVFADGFKDAADGIGAGLLARKGDVFYTCIPDLWRLRDKDGDGKAEIKESLSTGYGVHVAYSGHDLHGLVMGPDGRLYFSVGDRGLNVTTKEGKRLYAPDTGSVLRCDLDGSNLEIFATGLRNPQELAFDNYGNLFTCDNNADGGDKARWVHLVEGGDSGWRMGYQYINFPNTHGPWEAERLWQPRGEGQPAYIVPPVANIADGPSGLAHDPGTGLPARYRDHFFLVDFRGGAGNSGVRSFANTPKGASFELVDSQEFAWSVLATDVDFGPDGAMYISDWVDGWEKTGKGRIWKVTGQEADPNSAEVKTLLAEGMETRPVPELAKLFGHPDQRVRQEAQFELADRVRAERVIDKAGEGGRPAYEKLVGLTQADQPRMVRLHAIWCLGQAERGKLGAKETDRLLAKLFKDGDAEVRAQAVKVVGEAGRRHQWAGGNHSIHRDGDIGGRELVETLLDKDPRVQFQAAIMAGRLPLFSAYEALIEMLRSNNDKDPYLRHAAVMGLAGLGKETSYFSAPQKSIVKDFDNPESAYRQNTIARLLSDPSPAVRIGVVLALRRLGRSDVARFLGDSDPKVSTEAGLAIYEAPIPEAMPALADLASKKGMTEALQRRAINAANRVGRGEDAAALASVATRNEASKDVRVESLSILATWAKPPGRDRINGLWRPIDVRPSKVAADALRPSVKGLLEDSPDEVRRGTIAAVAELGIKEAGPDLVKLVVEGKGSGMARADAIKALETLDDPRLADAVEVALGAVEGRVRSEGLRVLARINPERAIPVLAKVLDAGSSPEQQQALEALGSSDRPEADAILATWLGRLVEHKVPASIELELLDAASKKKSTEVLDRLARFEQQRPKDGPLADHHAELEGGNAERGRKIFRDNAAVYCTRCHKVREQGGEVGPDLTGIGGKQPRTYLLESIVVPNQAIAQGFESVVLAKTDGTVVTGVLKSEDDKVVRVMTAEAKLIEVPKADVEERKRGASAMPEDLAKKLTKAELRDLVEFLAGMK